MILHLHLWQSQNGAAHRVYCDTPPLPGWRVERRRKQLFTPLLYQQLRAGP